MVDLNELTELWRDENVARGYREVKTPILYDVELLKPSGHWHVYRDNMYFTDVEDRPMGLKPMNCPAHVQIYKDAAPLLPRPADPLLRGRASCTATSRAGRCTGCCASATSPRTTRTSSAPRSRSQDEVNRCLDFGFAIYDTFGFDAAARALDAAREADRHRGDVGPRRGGAPGRAR